MVRNPSTGPNPNAGQVNGGLIPKGKLFMSIPSGPWDPDSKETAVTATWTRPSAVMLIKGRGGAGTWTRPSAVMLIGGRGGAGTWTRPSAVMLIKPWPYLSSP